MSYNKETGMYDGYIYLLTNTINNKVYVGQTIRTINARVWEHFHKEKKYAISLAVQKYGQENFISKELCKLSATTKKELIKLLNEREKFYIQEYDSLCGHNGYNIDKGGGQASYNKKPVCQYDLNRKLINIHESAAEAYRITGIYFGDISKCCLKKATTAGGYFWTFLGEELDLPEKLRIPNRTVSKYTLDGEFVCKYNCVNDISDDKRFLNRIRNCCIGRQYNVNGFVYRYDNDPFDKYKATKKSIINNTIVNQYTKEGIFIKTYTFIKEAEKENNICKGSISNVCRGKTKTAGGYKWFYANDPNQPDKTKIIN